MSRTLEMIESELDAKIPRSAVAERDGGGGRRLSYLEGFYVIDRLNKIFGPTGWTKEILDVRQVENATKNGVFPAYLVKVRLSIHVSTDSALHAVKEAYGYGSDKSSQNAHELAIKEAVTDALKVAAKDLGMSLGLALYDKTQENVDDDEEDQEVKQVVQSKPISPKVVAKAVESPSSSAGAPTSTAGSDSGPSAEKLRAVIRSHVSAAIKKGVLTMDGMKGYLSDKHGAVTLDELHIERLTQVLEHVQTLTK